MTASDWVLEGQRAMHAMRAMRAMQVRLLGRGAFGVAVLMRHRKTGHQVVSTL